MRAPRLASYMAGMLASGALHGLAILALAAVITLPFVDGSTWKMVLSTMSLPNFHENVRAEILIHLGLAACTWTLLVIGVRYVREHRREQVQLALKKARGTILTELLIILVPFLMLLSGLAQLAILNISQILGHLAAYNAARVYMVWEPDMNSNRWKKVNPNLVKRKARLAAAAAFAPAAPSYFEIGNVGGQKAEMEDLRATMYASFTSGMGSQSGGTDVKSAAAGAVSGGPTAEPVNTDLWNAFDGNAFTVRAARKLTFAWAATRIRPIIGAGSQVGCEIRYQQHMVFPWFAWMWGQNRTVAGRKGQYVEIKRTATFPRQVQLP